jgi:hypothetical protein
MHAIRFLSRWLSERAVVGHQARLSALLRVVEAALAGGALSLTQLGRRRRGTAHEKHQIKAVDRLLGNHHLHREHDRLYSAKTEAKGDDPNALHARCPTTSCN